MAYKSTPRSDILAHRVTVLVVSLRSLALRELGLRWPSSFNRGSETGFFIVWLYDTSVVRVLQQRTIQTQ